MLCPKSGNPPLALQPQTRPSASDARLGRSKASHINTSFSCRLHCSFADPTTAKLDSTTLEATHQTAHVRCGHSADLHLFQGLYTAQDARHSSESLPLCALIFMPKITLHALLGGNIDRSYGNDRTAIRCVCRWEANRRYRSRLQFSAG